MIKFTLGFVVGITIGVLLGSFLICCFVVSKDDQWKE